MIENENPQRCHHAMATRKLIVRNAANLIARAPPDALRWASGQSAPLFFCSMYSLEVGGPDTHWL